jgi:predicted Zn-dependent peptidase
MISLKKYAHEVIPTFAEMLQSPSFPEDELENFRRTNIQELLVELEKGETVAYRKVTELIFGEQHPYGYNSMPRDYTAIQRADLQYFFDTWYTETAMSEFFTYNNPILMLIRRQQTLA